MDRDDIQRIASAQIHIDDRLADHAVTDFDLDDLDILADRQEVHEILAQDALGDAQRHVPFRINNGSAQLGKHLALFRAGRLGDDRHAQIEHVQRDQDAGFDFAADTDGNKITILDPDLDQHLF